MWCNVLQPMKHTTQNFITSNNDIMCYGLKKYYKHIADFIAGSLSNPTVLWCQYCQLSYFLSEVLRPLIAMRLDVCESTEDLFAGVNINVPTACPILW